MFSLIWHKRSTRSIRTDKRPRSAAERVWRRMHVEPLEDRCLLASIVELTGPLGFVGPGQSLSYALRFENPATAPAQKVEIDQVLNRNFDLTTFQFTGFELAGQTLTMPVGSRSYAGQMNLVNGWTVDVSAELLTGSSTARWTFSVAPQLPGVGFLPQNTPANTPAGAGWIGFSVRPLDTVNNGDLLEVAAEVKLDYGNATTTDNRSYQNIYDVAPPTSQVDRLAAQSSTSFVVSWSGDPNGGAEIAVYDVYVLIDSRPAQLWLTATTETSARYEGQAGHWYTFYSMATNVVGHRQTTPLLTTTTKALANPWHNESLSEDVNGDKGVSPVDILALITHINAHPMDQSLPAPPAAPPPYLDVNGDGVITALDVLAVVDYLNRHPAGEGGEGEAPAAAPTPASGSAPATSSQAVLSSSPILEVLPPASSTLVTVVAQVSGDLATKSELREPWLPILNPDGLTAATRPLETLARDSSTEDGPWSDLDAQFGTLESVLSSLSADVSRTWQRG